MGRRTVEQKDLRVWCSTLATSFLGRAMGRRLKVVGSFACPRQNAATSAMTIAVLASCTTRPRAQSFAQGRRATQAVWTGLRAAWPRQSATASQMTIAVSASCTTSPTAQSFAEGRRAMQAVWTGLRAAWPRQSATASQMTIAVSASSCTAIPRTGSFAQGRCATQAVWTGLRAVLPRGRSCKSAGVGRCAWRRARTWMPS
mmetsp:Transcript_146439/g.467811  ORF Transcript_146439/g.467811 Transcript_146439/m.467811 type:complete len:201 (+) Transcript_146439:643-1245(+)